MPAVIQSTRDSEPFAVPVTSPTGTPVVPPWMVPYLVAAGAVAVVVSDELADPAPWTPARGMKLFSKVLPILIGGLSPGLRWKPAGK